jgi:hypothetical protein
VHVLTAEEVSRGGQGGTITFEDRARTKPILIVTQRELERWIPNIYWVTMLGPSYAAHFGRNRISSSPAHEVEEVAADTFLLQLTPSIEDLRTDFSEFEWSGTP